MPRRKRLKVPTHAEVLAAVEEFLTSTGHAEWRFGHEICNDPNLIREMRGGRNISLKLAGDIARYIS